MGPNVLVLGALLLAGVQVHGYWLMGANNVLTTQRLDPIVNPGVVGTHVHSVLGGSNFGLELTTASLRESECTSMPIAEDKSNYWYPHMYFWWRNGSFSSLEGNPVIYYLYSDDANATTAFPDDFRMMSGDPALRTSDPSSHAQRAITFLCLDFDGESERSQELPDRVCPSGIRAEINFPSCWDGKNVDSEDHRSHVAFLSEGPDRGTCSDPNFPVTIPRIFLEVYWYTQGFDDWRDEAMDPDQPFVFSNGDPTGYSYHGDFYNGWDAGALERAIAECNCNPFGDPACCVDRSVFTYDQQKKCHITDTVDETTLGVLAALPGANEVAEDECGAVGQAAERAVPALLAPVFVHNGTGPDAAQTATVSVSASTVRVTQDARRPGCESDAASGSPSARSDLAQGVWLLWTVVGLAAACAALA